MVQHTGRSPGSLKQLDLRGLQDLKSTQAPVLLITWDRALVEAWKEPGGSTMPVTLMGILWPESGPSVSRGHLQSHPLKGCLEGDL